MSGCIGKCTSGLSPEELDRITDHIHWTLGSAQGRQIFRKYLSEARRTGDLACLELHEQCCQALDNERLHRPEPDQQPDGLQALLDEGGRLLALAEQLDDVEEIDLALLERFTEALQQRSKPGLLAVLDETKCRLTDHLRQAHRGFRIYAKRPCPRTARPH